MKLLAIFICALSLLGCATQKYSDNYPGNTIFDSLEVMDHNFSNQQAKIDHLQSMGINFYQLGDKIMLMLPTDELFVTNSPAYTQNFYRVMDTVVEFLADYNKVNIKVAGFSDNVGLPERNLALSRARARKAASYLWEHGVDTRLIYSIGYGSQAPIASNKIPSGRYINRRIEITLQQVSS